MTQTVSVEDWGEYIYKVNPETLDSLKQICFVQATKKIPRFLKERYAFQYLKCAYYAPGNEEKEVEFIYNNFLEKSNSITAQWSNIYYAMLKKDQLEQTYYLVKAFDKSDAKKYRAFSLLSTTALKQLEQHTNDADAIVMARTLTAMKNPGRGLEDIQFVYRNNPESKYLPLLITREIKKLEDWLYSPEVLYFQPFLKENYYATTLDAEYARINFNYDKSYLQAFLTQLLDMQFRKLGSDAFMHIAIAHLYNMQHEHSKAWSELSEMQYPGNAEEEKAYLLEKLFTLVNVQPILKKETQSEIAKLLSQLEGTDVSNILLYLSRKYQMLGATVTAGLLHEKAGVMTNEYLYYPRGENDFYGFVSYFEKYAQPNDIDELLQIKHKSNKTDFEHLITPAVWGPDETYYELKGTLYIRMGDFAGALKAFEKLSDNFWETTYEFKDYLPKSSVSEVENVLSVAVGNNINYSLSSKKQILQDILSIQNKINQSKNNKEKALYTFWLANARFNISYFGKAWMMYAYGKTIREPNNDPADSYRFAYYYINPSPTNNVDNYYYLNDARTLYKEALRLAIDDVELSAKCVLMLGVCDELQYAFTPRENATAHYRSPYKQDLAKKYRQTNFFKQMVVQCPDLNW